VPVYSRDRNNNRHETTLATIKENVYDKKRAHRAAATGKALPIATRVKSVVNIFRALSPSRGIDDYYSLPNEKENNNNDEKCDDPFEDEYTLIERGGAGCLRSKGSNKLKPSDKSKLSEPTKFVYTFDKMGFQSDVRPTVSLTAPAARPDRKSKNILSPNRPPFRSFNHSNRNLSQAVAMACPRAQPTNRSKVNASLMGRRPTTSLERALVTTRAMTKARGKPELNKSNTSFVGRPPTSLERAFVTTRAMTKARGKPELNKSNASSMDRPPTSLERALVTTRAKGRARGKPENQKSNASSMRRQPTSPNRAPAPSQGIFRTRRSRAKIRFRNKPKKRKPIASSMVQPPDSQNLGPVPVQAKARARGKASKSTASQPTSTKDNFQEIDGVGNYETPESQWDKLASIAWDEMASMPSDSSSEKYQSPFAFCNAHHNCYCDRCFRLKSDWKAKEGESNSPKRRHAEGRWHPLQQSKSEFQGASPLRPKQLLEENDDARDDDEDIYTYSDDSDESSWSHIRLLVEQMFPEQRE